MAGKHDIERYIRALVAKTLDPTVGLNSYITAVNANVDDVDPQIALLDDAAISIQWLRDTVLNYSPFLMVFIADIPTSEPQGNETLKKYLLHYEISFDDEGQDDLTGYRAYRYSRAVEDFIEKNWVSISGDIQSKVTSLTPISYIISDRRPLYSVGVKIEVDIA